MQRVRSPTAAPFHMSTSTSGTAEPMHTAAAHLLGSKRSVWHITGITAWKLSTCVTEGIAAGTAAQLLCDRFATCSGSSCAAAAAVR